MRITESLAPGSADVYQTSTAGLGIRYVVNAPTCNATNLVLSNNKLRFDCSVSGPLDGPYVPTDISITTSFVAIGPIHGGASTLSSVPVLGLYFEASDNPGKLWTQFPVYTGSATGSLVSATCSVQTEALAVTLPTPAVRAFSSGIGAVAGRQAFSLSFACSSGAQVSIVITDAVDPSNRSNVLKLAADSTAKGIGVQVLKDQGTTVFFGPDEVGQNVANQWLIGASPNGLLVLPLSAQYIRTGNVEPGSVRALATFTMSYQ
jgi:type 1 fimbria pilin